MFRLNLQNLPPKNVAPVISDDYVTFTTGSTSASLIYLNEEEYLEDGYILQPTQTLNRLGRAVFGGELGNTFHPDSVNKNSISGIIDDLQGCLNWSEGLTSWSKDKAKLNVDILKLRISKFTTDIENLNRENKETGVLDKLLQQNKLELKNAELQIHYFEKYENSENYKHSFICEKFSVVYEFRILQSKVQTVASDIKGEVKVQEGCKLSDLQKVLVPESKVELLKTLLPRFASKINSFESVNLEYKSSGEFTDSNYSKPNNEFDKIQSTTGNVMK